MNTVSQRSSLTATLVATLFLAALFALAPKAHAQTGASGYGPIVRFSATTAGANTFLPSPPANIKEVGPRTNGMSMTYTVNAAGANGMPVQHHIVVDCLSKDLKSCDWMQAAATSLGYTRNSSRGTKQGELAAYCAVYGEVARCSGPHGMPDRILNAYNRAQADAKARAAAATKK